MREPENDAFAQDQAKQPAPRQVDLSFQWVSKDKVPGNIYRTAVPGGWLVVLAASEHPANPSMTFIPDENHKWDGKSIPVSR